jgi:hypothetical protein
MATVKIEVRISVDAIQFERVGNKVCLCGNSHQKAAETAWVDAFDEHPGFIGRIDWGNDHHRHDCYIDEIEYDDDGNEVARRTWWPARRGGQEVLVCEGGGEASPEVVEALRRARDIESTACNAALAAADEDCGTTDEDRAEDDQAGYWLGEIRRAERESEQVARIAARIALLPPALAKLAGETVARLSGASRSTRKRAWRTLRANIGAEATLALQGAVTGFGRQN